MAANSKPGIATACAEAQRLAKFTAAHRNSIIAITTVLSPGDVVAVTAALDTIQGIATLFDKICKLWELSLALG